MVETDTQIDVWLYKPRHEAQLKVREDNWGCSPKMVEVLFSSSILVSVLVRAQHLGDPDGNRYCLVRGFWHGHSTKSHRVPGLAIRMSRFQTAVQPIQCS